MTERLSDERLEQISKGHMTVSKHDFPEERRMAASELIHARSRIAELEKLDREAATCVESVICMRTGFTGEPPYVGWRGLGLALTEALDERDRLRAAGPVMPPLFETGWFRLHSGEATTWRINCEVLSDESIKTLAAIIADRCKFGSVEGVPTGGLSLAEALRPLATTGPLLIVDDVLTTGSSMEEHRAGRDAIGYVIFDRSGGGRQPWVRALWSDGPVMPEAPSAAARDVLAEPAKITLAMPDK